MKKMQSLLTLAVIGCVGVSSGTAQAGNYRPTNSRANSQLDSIPLERNTSRPVNPNFAASKTTNANPNQQPVYGPQPVEGTKTACCYNSYYSSCYTVPVCNSTYCTPIVQCGSSYLSRPYFPASSVYPVSGYGGYGGYGSYPGYGGYGGYGSYPGYGAGLGGYGVGIGGAGGYGGYAPGVGGGIYGNPGYGVPLNPGLGAQYGAPMIGSPYGNPIGNPYVNPVGNPYGNPVGGGLGVGAPGFYPSSYNAGFTPNITPISQPYYGNSGFSSPIISPVYSDPNYGSPIISSPFYP